MTRAKPILLITAAAFAIAACEPIQSDDPRANTKRGVVAGAAVGAIAGLAGGGEQDAKKALLGAAAGAAIGAAIGDQLDRQAAELRQAIGNDQVRIVNTGNELIVTLPQDIVFDVDSAVVRPGLRSDLAALAANLQRYPNTVVEVVGHTDNTGEASYNQDLSARRAQSVAAELFANGIPPSRVATFGRGEDQPVASNLTPEGRQQNRRVEIFIRPVG